MEDLNKLAGVRGALRKDELPGTKIQIKPSLGGKTQMLLRKVRLILKWGGEPTHSARYQAWAVRRATSSEHQVVEW